MANGVEVIVGRDLMLRTLSRLIGLRSDRLAVFFLLAGFGALSFSYLVLALLDSALMQYRGLFSYYSATIGDGLLLPFAIGVSAAIMGELSKFLDDFSINTSHTPECLVATCLHDTIGSRMLGLIPGLFALAVTFAVHALWVMNPNTEPNWTIQGGLNFFGYWHAVFMCIVIWWFVAFLLRMAVFLRYLPKLARVPSMLPFLLRLYGNMNVLMFVVGAFAMFVYFDNYGATANLATVMTSVTTLTLVSCVVGLILGVNAVFVVALYRPYRLARVSGAHADLPFLSRRTMAALFVGLLIGCAPALFFAVGKGMEERHTAALVTGLLIPILFVENYFADLFWNHDRKPDLIHVAGGVLVFLICSGGLLLSLVVALKDGPFVATMFDHSLRMMLQACGRGAILSFFFFLVCLAIPAFMAWIYTPEIGRVQVTNNSSMHNMTQNFFQFWGLFQLIVMPVVAYVYNARLGLEQAKGVETERFILNGFSAFAVALLLFPITANIAHKLGLENRQDRPRTFPVIAGHINFQIFYSASVVAFVLAWLWGIHLKILE